MLKRKLVSCKHQSKIWLSVTVKESLNNLTEIKSKPVTLYMLYIQCSVQKQVLTTREYQRARMFIHWEIMQLQLAFCIDGKPVEKKQVAITIYQHSEKLKEKGLVTLYKSSRYNRENFKCGHRIMVFIDNFVQTFNEYRL